MSRVVTIAVVVALAGCCPVRPPANPDPRYRAERTPGEVRWRTRPVVLVADNQEFHFGGRPFLFRTGFADQRFSASAVRVPQQDAFGESLLALALSHARQAVTLHLGDALDLSCAGEWQRFVAVMTRSSVTPRDWFFTPGNHDGYFFGNFVSPGRQWRDACEADRPIDKAEVVSGYLGLLAARYGLDLGPLDQGSAHGTWERPAEGAIPLRRLAWRIDRERFWRSYVIQEIEVSVPGRPPAAIILLDTSTYGRAPRARWRSDCPSGMSPG